MRGTSGRCPPPRASRDRGEYPPHSVLSSARLRSLGFCLSKAFRPFIGPIEPGFTRARHEPAIGATKILPAPKLHGSPWQRTARAERSARIVGLRQSLVRSLGFARKRGQRKISRIIFSSNPDGCFKAQLIFERCEKNHSPRQGQSGSASHAL